MSGVDSGPRALRLLSVAVLAGAVLAGELGCTGGEGGDDESDGGNGSGGETASGGGAGDGGAASSGGAGAGNGAGGAGQPLAPSFILGADITITLEDEHWGATYTDVDGAQRPLELILARHGFNFVRIDTFVEPSAPGGYAADAPESFRDYAHTLELAQRVKARGLGFLLDLHLSDTWTNPGAQAPPSAWAALGDAELEEAVHDYVYETVSGLRDAGASPELVQIGNEITNGFLWDAGRIVADDFSGLARYLRAGIAAVREVDPAIRVVLHIEQCDDLAASRWWLDGVLAQGVEFDVLGQSCYAPLRDEDGDVLHPGYQGEPAAWQSVFSALAEEYPALDFLILEYSTEQRAAAEVMRSLPDGRGLGTFNWAPTRSYETHPNEPLFVPGAAWNDYRAVPERLELYDRMADDFGLR